MDFNSMEFLSALLAIVVIDLVLAGDNAIVIALAARSLSAALQKKAIAWTAAQMMLHEPLLRPHLYDRGGLNSGGICGRDRRRPRRGLPGRPAPTCSRRHGSPARAPIMATKHS